MEKLSGIYGFSKEKGEPKRRTLAVWWLKGCRQLPGKWNHKIVDRRTDLDTVVKGRTKLGPLEVLEWME